MRTHLLLGSPDDACCAAVRAGLEARGHSARILANPLASPVRFAWRLESHSLASDLTGEHGSPLTDDEIASVFVRDIGRIDASGWQADDLAYMQAETQAALLGWLWSLACPVVNRSPASIWYRPQLSLLFWQPLLRRCGLPTQDAVLSNVEHVARAFGERRGGSAIYAPLTGTVSYRVEKEEEWAGLAAMQRYAPVCLVPPHGAPHRACVVGEQVVWDTVPPQAPALERGLRRLAAATGLAFVEVAFAAMNGGLSTVSVEPQPRFDLFGPAAQQAIVTALVDLLTAELAGTAGRPALTLTWRPQ